MIKSLPWSGLLLGLALAFVGCSQFETADGPAAHVADDSRPGPVLAQGAEDDDDGKEELVPADEIPAAVKKAAQAAVPGLSIKEAEKEHGKAGTVYCVHGTANGVFHECEVTPDGKVLEIEKDDDEDDEDDDD